MMYVVGHVDKCCCHDAVNWFGWIQCIIHMPYCESWNSVQTGWFLYFIVQCCHHIECYDQHQLMFWSKLTRHFLRKGQCMCLLCCKCETINHQLTCMGQLHNATIGPRNKDGTTVALSTIIVAIVSVSEIAKWAGSLKGIAVVMLGIVWALLEIMEAIEVAMKHHQIFCESKRLWICFVIIINKVGRKYYLLIAGWLWKTVFLANLLLNIMGMLSESICSAPNHQKWPYPTCVICCSICFLTVCTISQVTCGKQGCFQLYHGQFHLWSTSYPWE